MSKFKRGTLELTLWCLVFSITAAFQFWRGAPVDGAMFSISVVSIILTWFFTKNKMYQRVKNTRAMNRSIFLWSSIAILISGWELFSYIFGDLTGRDYETPTISMLVSPFIAHKAGLVFFLLIWVSLGYFIVRRPRKS